MRIFTIVGTSVAEVSALPSTPVAGGYVWVACARGEFDAQQAQLQAALPQLGGAPMVDLHLQDLLNPQLPSRYDYTSQYDLLVFRRLATGQSPASPSVPTKRSGPPILRRINTDPVGFAVFDQVLLTVHPDDCSVRDMYAERLQTSGGRVPTSPADLMLRIVNQMVDGYLDLRRELSRQLDHWQTALLQPGTRFTHWSALLDTRLTLHRLDDVCEEQRAALQDWIEAVKTWPEASSPAAARERELLQVRSRDVLEHIERVVRHVQRLEQNMETTVQMHFSVQSNRTNDIMRTLTVLTAIFLPLNLMAGIFGMNFDFIPLLHQQSGFWWTLGAMALIAVAMGLVFWRKQYLRRTGG
jgi:magnesium/cobalt transport protein CorA